jgi:hypothetical protein
VSEPIAAIPMVPVSWGEVIDKITILEIKVARLTDNAARANVSKELDLLREIAGPAMARRDLSALVARLKHLNETLWDIEDRIRDYERAQNFDSAFIDLARLVYRTNDERGRLKREINRTLGSGLVEEKSYQPY